MFTGIIEEVARIKRIQEKGKNVVFTLSTPLAKAFKVDQSIAHNGVCLTVTEVNEEQYTVVAVDETLQKTALGQLKVEDYVNLERSMKMGDRLDGHMVYGHVDDTGTCEAVEEKGGSFLMTFSYHQKKDQMIVEKGSICINGTSLTAFNVSKSTFQVAIIPYTWENTTIQYVKKGDKINLEFDILGKYIAKIQEIG
jgi:riboflavin synthase